jgi:hypothetical protein
MDDDFLPFSENTASVEFQKEPPSILSSNRAPWMSRNEQFMAIPPLVRLHNESKRKNY